MKNKISLIVAMVAVVSMFSGCVTDGIYNVAKAGYKGGKVVVQNVPISKASMAELKIIDKGATTYDKARGVLRKQLDKGKPQTATTSSTVVP